jgi:hypothetical protein
MEEIKEQLVTLNNLMGEVKEELAAQTKLLQKMYDNQIKRMGDIDIKKHLAQITVALKGTPFESVLSKMMKGE